MSTIICSECGRDIFPHEIYYVIKRIHDDYEKYVCCDCWDELDSEDKEINYEKSN